MGNSDSSILIVNGEPIQHLTGGEPYWVHIQRLIDDYGPLIDECEGVEYDDPQNLSIAWCETHAGIYEPCCSILSSAGEPIDWRVLTSTFYIFELDEDEAVAVEEYCTREGIEFEE